MFKFCKASRDSKKNPQRDGERPALSSACVVVAVATEHGPVEESSSWKALFGESVGLVHPYLQAQPVMRL